MNNWPPMSGFERRQMSDGAGPARAPVLPADAAAPVVLRRCWPAPPPVPAIGARGIARAVVVKQDVDVRLSIMPMRCAVHRLCLRFARLTVEVLGQVVAQVISSYALRCLVLDVQPIDARASSLALFLASCALGVNPSTRMTSMPDSIAAGSPTSSFVSFQRIRRRRAALISNSAR